MNAPRLLLLSNSTQHGSGYLEYSREFIRSFLMKYNVKKILFVPYAKKDYNKYARIAKNGFEKIGIDVESIHEKPDAVQAVKDAEAFFVGGGNTFLLLKTLYEKKIVDVIREQVFEHAVPYMGASAGSNVAAISICTTNDMPICYPPSFDALKLVPFNINPHYVDSNPDSKHMGETRDDRIKEFHEIPDTPPVLGLREGCILFVEGQHAILQGISGAKLFESGKDAVEYHPGDDVSFLLNQ